jgi:lysosomal alpha-mannosidase
MGFDALFFGRLDYQDKNKRMNEKSMEWIWMPNSESLGSEVNLFTHAMYNQYQSPNGLDFDMLNDYDPWVNDKNTDTFNGETYAQAIMKDIDDRAEHYLTDDIFVVFGGDFEYMNAFQNYASMDNMIAYMNENYGEKYHFRYSTPSDYVDAVAKHDVKWPTKYDDMFPYSDSPDSYWTGYFSSRANDKEYIRRASSNFHSSSQLMSGKVLDQQADQESIKNILSANYEMQNELGINQHHDAVTGTGKQAVANDYALRLFKGMK